jgi:hypothetical protein
MLTGTGGPPNLVTNWRAIRSGGRFQKNHFGPPCFERMRIDERHLAGLQDRSCVPVVDLAMPSHLIGRLNTRFIVKAEARPFL